MGYFSCPLCEQQTISNIQDLHLKITTALSSNLKCPICNFNLNGLSNLHSHISSHISVIHRNSFSDGTPLPIEQIPSIEKLDIRDESRQNSLSINSVNYNCNMCGLVFSSEYFLNIHKEIIHSHSGAFEISCKLCKSKFTDLELYRNHVNEVHSGQRYFCQECPKSFKMKGGLLVHTRMFHDQSSPNYCTICKKSFTNKARKVIHQEKYHVSREIPKDNGTEFMDVGKVLADNKLNQIQVTTEEQSSNKYYDTSQNVQKCNQIVVNDSLTEKQNINLHFGLVNNHKSGSFDSKILLSDKTRLSNDTRHDNFISNNSQFDSLHCESQPMIKIGSAPALTLQSNFPDSMEMEIPLNYQNQAEDQNIYNSTLPENDMSCFSGIPDTKHLQTYPSNPVHQNEPKSSSGNSNFNISRENSESDESKLFELLLWSNSTSPVENTNLNDTTDTQINLQSQAIISAALPNNINSTGLISSNPQSTMPTNSYFNVENDTVLNRSPQYSDPGNSPKAKDDSPKSNENKTWQCEECKKSFTTKYFLKKHKRLHTGETPYSCAECGKTFTFQQSYHKHVFYHTNDKPHRCPQCGRAFKEMSTLHNHIRIHTGEKPFICNTCGKAFRQRVSYLVHQRIHTGHMPYSCDTCKRKFRYKVSLRSHKCPVTSDPVKVAENTSRTEPTSATCSLAEAIKCSSKDERSRENPVFIEDSDVQCYLSNSTQNSPLCPPVLTSLTTDFDKDLFIQNLFS